MMSEMYEETDPFTDLYIKITFCCLPLSASVDIILYSLSSETDRVKPLTMRAALFCNFCKDLIS